MYVNATQAVLKQVECESRDLGICYYAIYSRYIQGPAFACTHLHLDAFLISFDGFFRSAFSYLPSPPIDTFHNTHFIKKCSPTLHSARLKGWDELR